jgi:hypothetical protein
MAMMLKYRASHRPSLRSLSPVQRTRLRFWIFRRRVSAAEAFISASGVATALPLRLRQFTIDDMFH